MDVLGLTNESRILSYGGVETCILFEHKWNLRNFASFEVLDDEKELQYFERDFSLPILRAAATHGMTLMIDMFLWRASPNHIKALGYPNPLETQLNVHRRAMKYARESFSRMISCVPSSADPVRVLYAVDIGPAGDGYAVDTECALKTVSDFRNYHLAQLRAAKEIGADLVAAWTCTTVAEAAGATIAAREVGLPIVVSTTLETDGRTPEGLSLGAFITSVDAATDDYPVFFAGNCFHPTHVSSVLGQACSENAAWLARFKGLRVNASCKSHAELDNSTELDSGNPRELAAQVAELQKLMGGRLLLLGGCCGTNAEHVTQIAHEWAKMKTNIRYSAK